MRIISLILAALLLTTACQQEQGGKTVVCLPVYGQSLALGEEAGRQTRFDSLAAYAHGRIVTQRMDHSFGYFDNNELKEDMKRLLHDQRRSFELTIYSMAQTVADHTGPDTLVCIFPGGRGATDIAHLGKGSEAYDDFLDQIQTAFDHARERGWRLVVPAICWMQGETDVTDYPGTDYGQLLMRFADDINSDVKRITRQRQDVHLVCYQTNPLTRAKRFDPLAYHCPETAVANALLDAVNHHPRMHASSPTYPYDFAREAIHIGAAGQRQHGQQAALAVLDVLHGQRHRRGLLPQRAVAAGCMVTVDLSVPCPPLVIDTIRVAKADHYGFSVVTPDGRNILRAVAIGGQQVRLLCTEPADSCRVRYAVNGDRGKSGRQHGPRGNLRDSQGDMLQMRIEGEEYPLHNWCWQFDWLAESQSSGEHEIQKAR